MDSAGCRMILVCIVAGIVFAVCIVAWSLLAAAKEQ
jgi:hypothetical protein